MLSHRLKQIVRFHPNTTERRRHLASELPLVASRLWPYALPVHGYRTEPLALVVVLPVFNDWLSLDRVLHELSASVPCPWGVIVVDDGSSEPPPNQILKTHSQSFSWLKLITLKANFGHQKALAVGLVAASESQASRVITMDSDGEDSPSDIATLHRLSEAHPGHIVLARRGKRRESLQFRFGYALYQALFRVLTGFPIRAGNFMLFPIEMVKSVAATDGIWTSLVASVMRARVRTVEAQIDRAPRNFGESKMDLHRLIAHGLGAISVFIDRVFARALMAALLMLGASFIFAGVVLSIRLFSDLPIPGWTTLVLGFVVIFSAQLVSFVLLFSLMVISQQRLIGGNPYTLSEALTLRVQVIGESPSSS